MSYDHTVYMDWVSAERDRHEAEAALRIVIAERDAAKQHAAELQLRLNECEAMIADARHDIRKFLENIACLLGDNIGEVS